MFDCMVKGPKRGLLSFWINLGRRKYFLNAYGYRDWDIIDQANRKKANQEQFLWSCIKFNANFKFSCKQVDALKCFEDAALFC